MDPHCPQALKDALLRMSGAVGTVCMILTTVSWFSIITGVNPKSPWFEMFELILNMIHLY